MIQIFSACPCSSALKKVCKVHLFLLRNWLAYHKQTHNFSSRPKPAPPPPDPR